MGFNSGFIGLNQWAVEVALDVLRKYSAVFLTETAETKPENSISPSKLPRPYRMPWPCRRRLDVKRPSGRSPTRRLCACKQIALTAFHKRLTRRRLILPAAIVCCCVSLAMCSADVQAMGVANISTCKQRLGLSARTHISIILYSSDFPGLFQSPDFRTGCLLLIRRNQRG